MRDIEIISTTLEMDRLRVHLRGTWRRYEYVMYVTFPGHRPSVRIHRINRDGFESEAFVTHSGYKFCGMPLEGVFELVMSQWDDSDDNE